MTAEIDEISAVFTGQKDLILCELCGIIPI